MAALPDTHSGPSFGSGNRDSVKKLVMDERVDLFYWAPKSADVTSNPALSITARGEEAVNGPLGAAHNTPTTPTINPSRTHARTHWPEPPIVTLSSWGHNELITIEKLVVGRVYDGKSTFLDPVNLTGSRSTK